MSKGKGNPPAAREFTRLNVLNPFLGQADVFGGTSHAGALKLYWLLRIHGAFINTLTQDTWSLY
jgi:hypothetical protein